MRRMLSMFTIITVLLLVSCNEKSQVVDINQEKSQEKESSEELSTEQMFLKRIQDFYNDSDYPLNVLLETLVEYDDLKDGKVKDDIIGVFNDSVLKALDSKNIDNYNYLYDLLLVPNSNEFKHDELLNDDVKKEIIEVLNPVSATILDADLSMEFIEEYNQEIKIGEYVSNIVEWLEDNNVSYDFIHYPDLLVLNDDNTVIEFKRLEAKQMFTIKDKKGKTVAPYDHLESIAKDLAEIAEEYRVKKEKELERQEKENKTIRIGMTDGMVLKRWGNPKDINKTITANHVSEQWVYPGNVYLYFEDGILNTIQK